MYTYTLHIPIHTYTHTHIYITYTYILHIQYINITTHIHAYLYIFKYLFDDVNGSGNIIFRRAADHMGCCVWSSRKVCEMAGETGAQREGVRIWVGSLRLS